MNQSVISIKALAVVFVYIARPDLRFGFLKGRMPKFYPLIILLAVINLLFLVQDFSKPYLIAFGVGISFWVLSILTYHQVKLAIERSGVRKIHNTIKVFAVLNLIACLWQIFNMYRINNTYPYDVSLPFPYGLSAGDNVFGIFFEYSYYNVMVSSMLVMYFLFKKDIVFCLINALTLLLVFANTGTLITLVALSLLLVASIAAISIGNNKSVFVQWLRQVSLNKQVFFIPVVMIFILLVSYLVSPENIEYAAGSAESKDKQDVVVTNNVSTDEQYTITKEHIQDFKGKMLSFKETYNYLLSSPSAFLFGAGPVRFSCVTAQRMAGYDESALFRKILPPYKSDLYTDNHMLIIKARIESPDEYRSARNWPDSLYNQVAGEYGILGIITFLIFYTGYYFKKLKNWTYSLWLSVLLVPFALFSYMFEHLGPIVFFELLMELDVKEGIEKEVINA